MSNTFVWYAIHLETGGYVRNIHETTVHYSPTRKKLKRLISLWLTLLLPEEKPPTLSSFETVKLYGKYETNSRYRKRVYHKKAKL